MGRRVSWWILLAGLLLIGLLVLDGQCTVVDGTVVSRHEGVDALIDPHWRPVWEIEARYEPAAGRAIVPPWRADQAAGPVTADLPIDLATYDRLAVGQQVRVLYFPPLPELARLADQPLAGVILGPLAESFVQSNIALDLALLAWIVLTVKRRWRPTLLTIRPHKLGLCLLHLAFLQLCPLSMLGIRDLLPPPDAPLLEANGTVQEVQPIRSVGNTRRGSSQRSLAVDLPRPYDRVLVSFQPLGWRQPVVAVDDAAVGARPALRQGDPVLVTYPAEQPRAGWIEGADHTHRLENRLFVHALITAPFALAVILGDLGRLLFLGLAGR